MTGRVALVGLRHPASYRIPPGLPRGSPPLTERPASALAAGPRVYAYHRRALHDGMVRATGSNDPRVFALGGADETVRWERTTDHGFGTVAPPSQAGPSTRLCRSRRHEPSAFDRSTGERPFRRRYEAEIGSPVAVGGGGAYFLGVELRPGASGRPSLPSLPDGCAPSDRSDRRRPLPVSRPAGRKRRPRWFRRPRPRDQLLRLGGPPHTDLPAPP